MEGLKSTTGREDRGHFDRESCASIRLCKVTKPLSFLWHHTQPRHAAKTGVEPFGFQFRVEVKLSFELKGAPGEDRALRKKNSCNQVGNVEVHCSFIHTFVMAYIKSVPYSYHNHNSSNAP